MLLQWAVQLSVAIAAGFIGGTLGVAATLYWVQRHMERDALKVNDALVLKVKMPPPTP